MRRWIVLAFVAALLISCGGEQQVVPAFAPPATAAAAATPTTDQVVNGLKTQLNADAVVVREITMEGGALPTLTINYEANITKMPEAGKQTSADLNTEIERSILIISKRVAAQLAAGFAVERVNLVLKFAGQTVGSTRIGARDMLDWSTGKIGDGEYRQRWAQ